MALAAIRGDQDEMDYREFLALRRRRHMQRGGWMAALIEAQARTGGFEPVVPVKLDKAPNKNAASDRTAIHKAAEALGIKHLDVVLTADAAWVCVLGAVEAGDA